MTRHRDAFTLIELMLAMTMGLAICCMATMAIIMCQKSSRAIEQQAAAAIAVRGLLFQGPFWEGSFPGQPLGGGCYAIAREDVLASWNQRVTGAGAYSPDITFRFAAIHAVVDGQRVQSIASPSVTVGRDAFIQNGQWFSLLNLKDGTRSSQAITVVANRFQTRVLNLPTAAGLAGTPTDMVVGRSLNLLMPHL
jgi:hypothetical protein